MWGEPELTSTYSCMALQPVNTLRKETLCVMRQSITLEARLVSLSAVVYPVFRPLWIVFHAG